jgi:asparagine synthase (glutamine-hydrolysing)
MTARVTGIYRLDRTRPLPVPDDLPAAPVPGGGVLHADESLLLLGDAGVSVAEADGVVALAWGSPPPDPHELLRLYARHGDDLGRALNGHFAVMIHDKPRDRLLLIQDRFPGIATAYRLERDGLLYFSNRIEPLVRVCPEERRRLDRRALRQYLADTYITAPATIYEGVRQLVCGECVCAENGRVTSRVYDDWIRPTERLTDGDQALATYRGLLDDAIGDWLERHPDSGFLLSGGLDSSAIVALAAERSDHPLPTCGIAAVDFHTDAPYARRVAERYGTDHQERLVDGHEVDDLPRIAWEMENPFYEPGMILSWCALSLAGERVDAVIGGETADQLFGASVTPVRRRYFARKKYGPLLKPWLGLVRTLARMPVARTSSFVRKVENKLASPYDPAYWCGRYGFRDCDMTTLLRSPLPEDDRYDTLAVPDTDLDALYNFGCTVLNRDYANHGILQINGRIGDLLGLETFSPFCDRRVVDHILSLDTELRFHAPPEAPEDFTYKALHRRLAYDLLEADIVDRPKQGGAINPLIHLLDETRLDRIRRAVLASDFLNDLCRREALAALFDDVPQNATRIMQMVALDLWHHLFIERPADGPPDFTLTEFLDARAG